MLELALRSAELWPGFAEELGRDSRRGDRRCARPARCCSRATATRRPSWSASSSSAARSASTCGACARARRGSSSPRSRRRCARRSKRRATTRWTRGRCWRALREACRAAGVQMRERAPLAGLDHDGRRLRARRSSPAASASSAGAVVLAAGPWSGRLEGLPERRRACRCGRSRARSCGCATRPGPGLLERVIRYQGGYVVPRGDGRYVLGGTVEERGFDLEPDGRRGLRAAARGARAAARRHRAGDRRALGRAAARGRRTTSRRSAAARARGRCGGRLGTTATGSCSRR